MGNSDDTHISPGDTEPSQSARHRTLKLLSSSQSFALRSLADASAIATNPAVLAEVYGATDVGRVRDSNQDQFLIAALERSLLIEGSSLPAQSGTRLVDTPQGRILVVADGIGGHGGGEVASAVTIDAMAHYCFEAMPWVQRRSECSVDELSTGLQDAVRTAQERVRRVAKRKGIDDNLGTTLTMAYVAWPDLLLVHVGDSRAYLMRDDALHRLTIDHTLAQQMIDGHMMTPEQAATSHFSHVLVNAVGGSTDDLNVELRHLRLQLDDQLLLCTDGLYDMLPDDRISAALRDSDPVVQVVRKLIAAANDAGGRDNVTAVLARF
ncbi:MAG TPA: protein phosphatase 2C domain-containing protein [Nannocystaceae bacterium]|nr:protein phosphatase 2C domain-containing protein [Nannocystaceae bacterium]